MACSSRSVVLLTMFLIWHPEDRTIASREHFNLNGSDNDPDYDMSAEKRLIQKLMSVYSRIGRAGRPVRNSSSAITVHFGLGLKQMELNEKERILTLSMWTKYEWHDEYLNWDPEQYGGLSQVTLDPESIWIPDIMLLNTADIDLPARSTMAVVQHTGMVAWFPHCIYHSACSVDVSNFPFDQQKCNLAFASWTRPLKEVDIVMSFPGGIDLTTFETEHRESSAWDILNVTAQRMIVPSEDEYPNFAALTFELVFRRKVVFSTYLLTLPCVFLAFLTLVVFWLPPDRPDRTALAMSTFSSFMVLLLILVEAAPPTARTIPTLGVYYCINMVIIAMTVVLSTLVINLSKGPRNARTPPSTCLKTFTLRYMSKMLIMPSVYKEVERRSGSSQGILLPRQSANNDVTNRYCYALRDSGAVTSQDDRTDDGRTLEAIRVEIEKTRNAIERLERSMGKEDHQVAEILWEWRSIAVVMDRFFFVLYVILITLSLALFFPRPKTDIDWGEEN